MSETQIENFQLNLGQVSIVVPNYDKAVEYYTGTLGFQLIEDTKLSDSKRWVVVSPNAQMGGCNLLLAKAATPAQEHAIGNQTGGRVFLFLYTNNFDHYYRHLTSKKVEIINGPREESYGKVLVFKDCFGNLWDLIERNTSLED